MVNSCLGNHGPIISHASNPNDRRNQIAECKVSGVAYTLKTNALSFCCLFFLNNS